MICLFLPLRKKQARKQGEKKVRKRKDLHKKGQSLRYLSLVRHGCPLWKILLALKNASEGKDEGEKQLHFATGSIRNYSAYSKTPPARSAAAPLGTRPHSVLPQHPTHAKVQTPLHSYGAQVKGLTLVLNRNLHTHCPGTHPAATFLPHDRQQQRPTPHTGQNQHLLRVTQVCERLTSSQLILFIFHQEKLRSTITKSSFSVWLFFSPLPQSWVSVFRFLSVSSSRSDRESGTWYGPGASSTQFSQQWLSAVPHQIRRKLLSALSARVSGTPLGTAARGAHQNQSSEAGDVYHKTPIYKPQDFSNILAKATSFPVQLVVITLTSNQLPPACLAP